MSHFIDLLVGQGWLHQLVRGIGITLSLAIVTLPFGFGLGLLLALAQNKSSTGLLGRGAASVVTLFRALPELLTIVMVYYGGQLLLTELLRWMGQTAQVEVSAFFAGVVALSLVIGAFSSEVFRAALTAVPKGQREACHALGMSPWTASVRVLFPQMLRFALPGLGNLWLVLLKDTALVSVIALPDLMRQTNLAVSATREPFFFYLLAFVAYLAMSLLSGAVLHRCETRMQRPYGVGAR